MLLQLSASPAGVQQEGAVRLDLGNDIEILDVRGLVAGHKVSHGDIVGAVDGLMAKAQVGLGNAAGLLGVILEVSLSVLVGVVTDDLDGVLVGANGTIGAQTPELAGDDGLAGGDDILANGQGQMRNVIVDADGEVVLLLTLHVVEHGLHLGRSGILGTQAIAAAQSLDVGTLAFPQGIAHVQIQRLAGSAGLLGAVQNGQALAGSGDLLQQTLHGEGTEQVDLNEADLLAALHQIINNLQQGLADGAHSHHNALSIGSTVVVEQLIVAASDLVDLAHVLLDNGGQRIIGAVAGLAGLEEGIGILQGVAQSGMLGAQGMILEALNSVPIQHLAQILIVQNLDLLDLVRGPEAIEEMLEGDRALDGRQVGNGAQVHALLHAGGSQLCPTGLAAGHDVGVVTEDGQRVGGHGTGRDVHNAGQLRTGDTVHGRDHQQQALRSSVGAGQGAGLQRAVHCAGRAGLRLHLDQLYGLAKQVLLAIGSPCIHMVSHGAGRSDGVNGSYLGKRIRYVCGSLITVHRLKHFVFCHERNSSYYSSLYLTRRLSAL